MYLVRTPRPAFAHDFRTATLPSGLTFARASSGTTRNAAQQVASVATDNPRYWYDTDGNCQGLLVERGSTNYQYYSEDMSTWTISAGSQSLNATTAPDGTTTGDLYTEGVTNAAHIVTGGNWTITGGDYVSSSVFVKDNGRYKGAFVVTINSFVNRIQNVFDTQELTASAVDFGSGSTTFASIEPWDDGWFRIGVGGKVDASTTSVKAVLYVNILGPYQGDGASGMYVWGLQNEIQPFPTSYIKTSGSYTARAVEEPYFLSQDWMQDTAGTIVLDVRQVGIDGGVPSSFPGIAHFYKNGSLTDGHRIFYAAGGNVKSQMYDGGAQQTNLDTTTPSYTALQRIVYTFDSTRARLYVDGTLSAEDTSLTLPDALNKITLGHTGPSDNNGALVIAQMQFYPRHIHPGMLA